MILIFIKPKSIKYSINQIIMDVNHVFGKLSPSFEKYVNTPYVEMEFRLGKFNGKFFDTNIGKDKYQTIYKGLSKYEGWEKIVKNETQVFFRDSDGIRIIVNDDGDKIVMNKRKLKNEDFKKIPNIPFDFRFGISEEKIISDDNLVMDKSKTKKRVSFIRKNVTIDMTEVTGDSNDIDSEEAISYQCEIEIMDPKKINFLNVIHKVNDIFIMLNNTK